MYLLLVFLPLIGPYCAGLFGRKLGPCGATCLLITFFLSLFASYKVPLSGCCVYIKFIPWINSELLNVDWGFLFVMCCVITFVSSIVHLYSTEYTAHDPHLPRFMSYLSLFTFFMLTLVTADNFIQMFVGWEGVGLCSYSLINFWFTRIQANKAVDYATVFALTPILTNKVFSFLGFDFDLISIICFFEYSPFTQGSSKTLHEK